ncbi:MAG: DUF4416 family protein [Thermodesulfobacteriota bacterium]|nr:DUF4416 family protein [Thermodesulfobacteriota bacterium]
MSKPRPPKPAKLVVGCFTKEKDILSNVGRELAESFGPPDVISPWLAFEQTEYYESEMGTPLCRRLMAFFNLIEQESLPDIKLFTNALEERFSRQGRRVVNIDPGYLLAERFVLATGKNFAHRVYLRAGIYADVTLIYHGGGFRALDWTYPDYAGREIIHFLKSVRDRYMYQMRQSGQ